MACHARCQAPPRPAQRDRVRQFRRRDMGRLRRRPEGRQRRCLPPIVRLAYSPSPIHPRSLTMAYFDATTFQARIIGAVVTEAQNANRTPQLELTLDLQGKLDADGSLIPVAPTRYPPRIFLSLTEKAIGTPDQPGPVGETLQFLGFDGDFNNPQQLDGGEGPLVNDHQMKYDGRC